MKTVIVLSIFLALTSVSCDNESQNLGCDPVCDPLRTTIKKVTDKEGRIGYSQEEDKWLIIASTYSVSYDSQDLGIVCGDLKEEFKQVGQKVKFSGAYKEKCGNNKGPIAGQTYYYLHVSKMEILIE